MAEENMLHGTTRKPCKAAGLGDSHFLLLVHLRLAHSGQEWLPQFKSIHCKSKAFLRMTQNSRIILERLTKENISGGYERAERREALDEFRLLKSFEHSEHHQKRSLETAGWGRNTTPGNNFLKCSNMDVFLRLGDVIPLFYLS